MSNDVFNLLVCPLHRDGYTEFVSNEKKFVCHECNNVYPVINKEGIEIPNFLINDAGWVKGFRGFESPVIANIQGQAFKIILEEGKITLDVGCGDNPRGNINIDCYIPKVIPNNFIMANAEYLPFKNRSIDVLTSNYNLEHLIDPVNFIRNAMKISRERVEIVTDNSEWIGDIFFRVINDGRIFHDEHYYKWSPEYLNNLLSRIGSNKHTVKALNLSNSRLVTLVSLLGKIPRIGCVFYRDLKATLWIE
jgi:uncharacterized protein YbaR (Trm112 family)